MNYLRRNERAVSLDLPCSCMQSINRAFSTDTATGRSVEMSFEPFEIDVEPGGQVNADRIPYALFRRGPPAMLHLRDLVSALYDPFSKEKSDGKRFVVPRCPHRYRDGFMLSLAIARETDTNLQRFLDGKHISNLFGNVIRRNSPDGRFGNREC